MFCGKCGTQNADDALVCSSCGAKLSVDQASQAATDASVKNRKVGMAAVAVAAVLVVVLIFSLFGGRSYEATVKKLGKAMLKADAKAIVNLFPGQAIDFVKSFGDKEYNKFIEDGKDRLQDRLDDVSDDGAMSVSYKIVSTEDITGRTLERLIAGYKNVDVEVSAAKTIEIELINKEETYSRSIDVSLIKVGRSWYLDFDSVSDDIF